MFTICHDLFVLSFPVPFMFPLAQTAFVLALAVVAADIILLFNKTVKVKVRRQVPKILSLGDVTKIGISLKNESKQTLKLNIIDFK